MTVRIRGLGQFRSIFGELIHSLTLPSGNSLQDVLRVIQDKWADRLLPPQLWDHEKCAARHPVVLMVDSKRISDMNTPVEENQEVIIMKVSVGG
jgi:molybdopterin converting factor small subunit